MHTKPFVTGNLSPLPYTSPWKPFYKLIYQIEQYWQNLEKKCKKLLLTLQSILWSSGSEVKVDNEWFHLA